MLLRVAALAVLLIVSPGVVSPGVAVAASGTKLTTWLAVGDLHIDPFDRGGPARAGRDTNTALFDDAIAAMHRAVPNPSVVVVPGDLLAHHFPAISRRAGRDADAAAIAVVRQITARFSATFPHAQFVVVLGNNDAPCGDYSVDAGGRFLKAAAHLWAPLVDRSGSAPLFLRAFAQGGAYAVERPAGPRILAIDTVALSSEFRGTCAGHRAAFAREQLSQLRALLAAAPPRARTVVVMHAPPGYDAFSTEMARGFLTVRYLDASQGAAALAAMRASRRVAWAIAGHAHRFDVRVFGGIPIVVFGALSPVYGNDPSFYALRVDGDGALRDVATYVRDDGGRWIGPHDFDADWGVSRIDAASLLKIHDRLATDPAMRRAWAAAAGGWSDRIPRTARVWRESTWRIPWCAQTEPDAGFAACAQIGSRTAFTRIAVVIAVLFACVGVAAVVATVVRAVARAKGSVPGPP